MSNEEIIDKILIFNHRDYCEIKEVINKLQEENKQLKENYKCIKKQRDDITKNATEQLERSIDDWSKLEEWLKEGIEEEINEDDISSWCGQTDEYLIDREIGARECLKGILKKIKELKGAKKI